MATGDPVLLLSEYPDEFSVQSGMVSGNPFASAVRVVPLFTVDRDTVVDAAWFRISALEETAIGLTIKLVYCPVAIPMSNTANGSEVVLTDAVAVDAGALDTNRDWVPVSTANVIPAGSQIGVRSSAASTELAGLSWGLRFRTRVR